MNKQVQYFKSGHQAGFEKRALQKYYWKYEYSGMDMPYVCGKYACGTFIDSKENVYPRSCGKTYYEWKQVTFALRNNVIYKQLL